MANVLVIGKGGREHALVWKLMQSDYVDRIYCAPGNAGTNGNLDYKEDDYKGITEFCKSKSIDLVVIGPESPLCNGLVDKLNENGVKAFGPTKSAAIIEGSKAWAKNFMRKYGIPTADFEVFNDANKAKEYIQDIKAPIVVKADGLAAGKGSIVCMTLEEALNAVDKIMIQKEFKDAGNKIVIEEYLQGEEASILALSDGKTIRTLISSQDHKPVFENSYDRKKWLETGGDIRYKDYEKGPNTGGMGAYAPAPIVTPEVMRKVYNEILKPTVKYMSEEGRTFIGCLYAGLMIKDNDVKVVEFNVRFGDPEAQPVLSLLENDLYSLLMACVNGELNKEEHKIKNKDGTACCVVMASGGYPIKYKKEKEIFGLDDVRELSNVYVFHAGTKQKDRKILTNGGRVLGVTATGKDIEQAINDAYHAVNLIHWENEYHRTDIGAKALKR